MSSKGSFFLQDLVGKMKTWKASEESAESTTRIESTKKGYAKFPAVKNGVYLYIVDVCKSIRALYDMNKLKPTATYYELIFDSMNLIIRLAPS